MLQAKEIQDIAIQVINDEKEAIQKLASLLNEDFIRVVQAIMGGSGRVIITGIGKSAIIGMKIVSTMNSTGTPAIFMHAADAIHGDLGIIQEEDLIICISKSGNTPEIKILVPLIKNTGNKLVAIVGNRSSFLAEQADYILDTTIEKEACPNNLAPTSSTTAQLVMGDALAIALLKCRGFSAKDFAKYHPGGALGKQLYMRVSNLYMGKEAPRVAVDAKIQEVILEMTSKRLGCTAVLSGEKLVGIITDGDLRRMIQKNDSLLELRAKDIMSENPSTINEDEFAVKAIQKMNGRSINQLLVVNSQGEYRGVIHLHDLIREGII